VLMARVMRVVREDGGGSGDVVGVEGMETTFDYNGFYAKLRQRELEATLL